MHQLTDSGEPGSLYNGVADWLYEEEILGRSSALYPAPGPAPRLAYISFNDSGVEQHEMARFGPDSGLKFRYPKAGTTNPRAEIFVQTLGKQGRSGDPVKVVPPEEVASQ